MDEPVSTLPPPSAPDTQSGTSTIVLMPSVETLDVDPIRLSEGRHCVGTDATCDVVLPHSGIAARHCLIVVGPRRTVVKALSPLTWINDSPVREDPLRVSDCLTLGPIEFQVCADPTSESRRPSITEELPAPLQELLDEAVARQVLNAAAATHEAEPEEVAMDEAGLDDDGQLASPTTNSDTLEFDFTRRVAPEEPAVPETGLANAVTNEREEKLADPVSAHRPISRDALFAEREAIEQSRSALQQQREYLAQLAESLDKRDRELGRRHADISDSLEKLGQKQLRLTDWEARLNEDRHDLSLERTGLRADGERLEGERNRIQGELAELQRQRNSLVQREECLRMQNEQLARVHAEQDTRERELSERSMSLQAEVAGVRQDRDELTGSRDALDQEREALDSERRAIEDRKNSLNDEQQALSAAKAALRSEEERLQEQIQSVTCREQQLAHEREHMCQLERGNEAERDALETERQEIARDNDTLRAERVEIEAARAALDSERAEFDELHHQATRDREELEIERQALVEQRNSLAEQEQLTEASRLRSAEEQDSLHQEEARLNEQRQTWEQDLSAHESRCKKLDQQLEEIQQHRRTVEAEREGLEQSRVSLSGEQAALESEREELSRRREQLDEWEAELTESKVHHTDLAQSLEQERERLEEERDAVRRDREALDEKQQALEAERDALVLDREQTVEPEEHAAQVESLTEEQTRLEAEREAVERDRQQLIEEQRVVDEARQSLEAERSHLAEQQEAWEREQETTATETAVDDTPAYDFSAEQQQLEQLRSEIDAERGQLEIERAELHRQISEFSAAQVPQAAMENGETDPSPLMPLTTIDGPIDHADSWTVTEMQEPAVGPEPAPIDSFIETSDAFPADESSTPILAELPAESMADSLPEYTETKVTPTTDNPEFEQHEVDVVEEHEISGLRDQLTDLFGDYSIDAPREDANSGDIAAIEHETSDEQTVDLVDEHPGTDLAPESDELTSADTTDADDNETESENDSTATIFDASDVIAETAATTEENEQCEQILDDPVDGNATTSMADSTGGGDSIAAYMERLLGRSNRAASEDRVRPVPQDAGPALQPAEKSEPSAESDPDGVQPAEVGDDAGSERRIPADVPKDLMRENLDSFRQLANMSARTAVAQHASKRLWSTVQMKVALTGMALALTSMLIAANLMGMGSYLIGSAVAGLITIVLAAELVRTLISFYRWRSVESAESWGEEEQGGPDSPGSEEGQTAESPEAIEETMPAEEAGEQAETEADGENASADYEQPLSEDAAAVVERSVESAESWGEADQYGPDSTDADEGMTADSPEPVEETMSAEEAEEQAQAQADGEIASADADDHERSPAEDAAPVIDS